VGGGKKIKKPCISETVPPILMTFGTMMLLNVPDTTQAIKFNYFRNPNGDGHHLKMKSSWYLKNRLPNFNGIWHGGVSGPSRCHKSMTICPCERYHYPSSHCLNVSVMLGNLF